MTRKNLWLSFDVEASGPVPGLHSMLSIGVVALLDDGDGDLGEADTFYSVLRMLDDTTWDPDTKRWFTEEQPRAYREVTLRNVSPMVATCDLINWLEELRNDFPDYDHVWTAWPIAFDMPFLRYYMQRFQKERWEKLYGSERFCGHDMKTLASDVTGIRYSSVSSSEYAKAHVEAENKFPHCALHDAEFQGHILASLLKKRRSQLERLAPHRAAPTDALRCAECGAYVDDYAMCVDDPGHETGHQMCVACDRGEIDGNPCVRCNGDGIVPS